MTTKSRGRARPLKHCLWYEGFGRHSGWGPRSVRDVARTLKVLALFFRGVIVADADLNNHEAFKGVETFDVEPSPHDRDLRVLYDALTSGFIIPAVRGSGEARRRQADIHKAFAGENPWDPAAENTRRAEVLDRILDAAAAEKRGPLIYPVAQVSEVYAHRISVSLSAATGDPAVEALAKKVLDYVRARVDRARPEIVKTSELAMMLREEPCAEPVRARVRALLDQSYNANIAVCFRGQFLFGGDGRATRQGPMVGPLSDDADRKMTDDVYLSLQAREPPGERATIEVHYVNEGEHWTYTVDTDVLETKTLAEIEDLRDMSNPDKYFDLRFDGAASPRILALSDAARRSFEEAYLEHLRPLMVRVKKRLSTTLVAQRFENGREVGAPETIGRTNALGGECQVLLDPSAIAAHAPPPATPRSDLDAFSLAIRIARADHLQLEALARRFLGIGASSSGAASGVTRTHAINLLRKALLACDRSATHAEVLAHDAGIELLPMHYHESPDNRWDLMIRAADSTKCVRRLVDRAADLWPVLATSPEVEMAVRVLDE